MSILREHREENLYIIIHFRARFDKLLITYDI